jgi:hypothetical protein
MTLQEGIAIALFLASAFVGLAASVNTMRMVDEVNSKLSPEQQFAPLGWHYFKSRRLIEEYRRLYPSGHLIAREIALAAVAFGLGLVGAGLLAGPVASAWLAICGVVVAWLRYRR